MQITRWRNVWVLKNSFVPAFLPPSSAAADATTPVASFHSTPLSSEKWKAKWNFDGSRAQQPSKNYVRYVVRQKRADAKRALKDILLNAGSSTMSFQDEDPIWKFDGTEGCDSNGSDKKRQSRFSGRRAGKSHHKKTKRRFRRESFSEDFDDHEPVFEARFGNKWYTWSPRGDSFFQNSEFGFELGGNSGWSKQRTKQWEAWSDAESEDEPYTDTVGSRSDRTILGLPSTGPLKIEDVKSAFRLSALKWHPDKHQGPSQAMAEEKFKLCVDAYNSLCKALA